MSELVTDILAWSGKSLRDACERFQKRLEGMSAREREDFGRDMVKSMSPNLTRETVLIAGVLLRCAGMPVEDLIGFFARHLGRNLTGEQFSILGDALFREGPPLPSDVLFDMTRYTYLDRRVMYRKAKEITDKLRKNPDPGMILYILLLSFRDDVNKENFELTMIVLSSFGYGEAARLARKSLIEDYEAYLNRARGESERQKNVTMVIRESPDHASYYLDKYFGDKEPAGNSTGAMTAPEAAAGPPPGRRPRRRRCVPPR
jgi:hypothetical protein